jgi:hypothetical protein
MLDGKLAYFINQLPALKTDILAMFLQEVKKNHLPKTIRSSSMRHA